MLIKTQAVKFTTYGYVPFWMLEVHEDESEEFDIPDFLYKDECSSYGNLEDVYWDTKTGSIHLGKVIMINQEPDFVIDEELIIEKGKIGCIDQVADIKWINFASTVMTIAQVKRFDSMEYYFKNYTPEQRAVLEDEEIYEFRVYTPTYYMKSGKEISETYELMKYGGHL